MLNLSKINRELLNLLKGNQTVSFPECFVIQARHHGDYKLENFAHLYGCWLWGTPSPHTLKTSVHSEGSGF